MRAASSRAAATASACSPRRRRQGRSRSTRRARPAPSSPIRSGAGSTASPPARTARSPGRPARRPACRPPRREERTLELGSSVGGLAFAPRGLPPRDRALQRRDALVPERAERRARAARMEGLASRRDVQPGRQVPGHVDAGAGAARLAPRRPQGHAHVGLSGTRALDGLDVGRQVARDLGRRRS